MKSTIEFLINTQLTFWDFDGVIKDSVDVKTCAFEALFQPYGAEVSRRVRVHHEANGGVSRFEKIPLYLEWASIEVTEQTVTDFCERFSAAVLQAVIDSPWVAGVADYLEQHYHEQHFVLVTATPQSEIEIILEQLSIAHFFQQVFGAPTSKTKAMAKVMRDLDIPPLNAVMIGDAESDLLAAEQNGIPFLLRRTPLNRSLQQRYHGPQFESFEQ